MKKRIIIAITGASGAIYGVRLLQVLQSCEAVETHLVISNAGLLNIRTELNFKAREVQALADVVHNNGEIGASIASGSFITEGMIIAPCSMKTLGSIANGIADNLVSRAADVVLKERKRLVLMVRETPLNLIHLRNMSIVTEAGGVIYPPVPAFYAALESLEDMVDHTVGRTLDLLGITDLNLVNRWAGVKDKPEV